MNRSILAVAGAALLVTALVPRALAMEPVELTASSNPSVEPGIQAEQAYFSSSRDRLSQGTARPADHDLPTAQQRAPQGYSVLDLSF